MLKRYCLLLLVLLVTQGLRAQQLTLEDVVIKRII